MDLAATIGIVVLLSVVSLVGVALTFLTISGAWLILLAALLVQVFRPETFSIPTLVIAAVLTLGADVLEFMASGVTAKRAGGSRSAARWSVVGGLVGAVVGTFFLPIPIVGTLAGAAIGAGACASAAHQSEGNSWRDASRVGAAALSGRLAATLVKVALTIAIGAIIVVASGVP